MSTLPAQCFLQHLQVSSLFRQHVLQRMWMKRMRRDGLAHNDQQLGWDFEAWQMPRIAGPGIGRDEIRRSRTAMGHWGEKWRGQFWAQGVTKDRNRQKRSKNSEGINRFLRCVSWNERKESQVLILYRMFESVFLSWISWGHVGTIGSGHCWRKTP